MARERRYRFQLCVGDEDAGPVCVVRARGEKAAKDQAGAYFRRVWGHKIKSAGGSYEVVRIPDRPPRERRF